MYEIFVAIITGTVQGITEFLPISSTAHNFLVSNLLGKSVDLEISNIIQFGTLIAIIQFYFSDLKAFGKRIWQVITDKSQLVDFFNNIRIWWADDTIDDKDITTLPKNMMVDSTIFQLVIATIPIVITALLMRKVVEVGLRTPAWIGFFMIVGAVLLAVADWYYSRSKTKKVKILDKLNVITIGIFQSFAIFPGMSRSGSCLAGSYFIGVDKTVAIRFAFLLSIPALGLSGVSDMFSYLKKNYQNISLLPDSNPNTSFSVLSIVIGTACAYFVGLICLRWLLNYLAKHSFNVFIFYRILIGFLLIALTGVGVIR